ncbi:hypothetical protein Mgra_00000079, partial [Meloidogyne graminicola]
KEKNISNNLINYFNKSNKCSINNLNNLNDNYCYDENMAYPLLLNNEKQKEYCKIKFGKKFNCELVDVLEKYKLNDKNKINKNISVIFII